MKNKFARRVFYLALAATAALGGAALLTESRELRQTLLQACWVALVAAGVAGIGLLLGRRRRGLPDNQSSFFVDSRPGI